MNNILNLLKTGQKQCICEFLPPDLSSRNKTKQTNIQSNLLTITISYEKE